MDTMPAAHRAGRLALGTWDNSWRTARRKENIFSYGCTAALPPAVSTCLTSLIAVAYAPLACQPHTGRLRAARRSRLCGKIYRCRAGNLAYSSLLTATLLQLSSKRDVACSRSLDRCATCNVHCCRARCTTTHTARTPRAYACLLHSGARGLSEFQRGHCGQAAWDRDGGKHRGLPGRRRAPTCGR